MSHLVSTVQPIASSHTVKQYAGFGIIGANIPTTGDNGGSPVLNDGIVSTAEYHWRVVTQPDSGTLTIYPDLSYVLSGASDGVHSWGYRLFENGVDQGTATVVESFGTIGHMIGVANSQQVNQASSGAIKQAHKVGGYSSQQINQASPGTIKQTHKVGVSSSQQINQASSGAIKQTHKVGVSSSQQVNVASPGSVGQSGAIFVSAANGQQVNQASPGAIKQTHKVGAASSQQVCQASSGAIRQTHRIGVANSQQATNASPGSVGQGGAVFVSAASSRQINQASSGAVRQTHRIGIASSQQINRCAAVRVTDGSILPAPAACFLVLAHQPPLAISLGMSLPGSPIQEMKMQSTYLKGGAVRLSMLAADADGSAVDPIDIRLSMRYEGGIVATLVYGQNAEIVRDGLGYFHADIPLVDSGQFYFRWDTDQPIGAAEGKIPVAAGRFQ